MSSAPSPERWNLLEPLLDSALALPRDKRVAFVRTSSDDDAMRADLLAMLDACERLEQDDTFLSQPAAEQFASLWDDTHDDGFVTALADRFVIEAEAGRGGMGVVYRAHDLRRDCPVALKVLRTLATSHAPERFRREIDLVRRLTHEHIVPLYDSGEDAGRLWYTMPFLDGETLGARIRRTGMFTIPDALRVLREVSAGLAHAHALGVIHRDLKPENIMLAGERTIICDFGIARALVTSTAANGESPEAAGHLTTTGVRVGTFTHMAPEQATGDRHVDHRADLYALGVVAYEMLSGDLPFPIGTRQSMLTALLAHTPPPFGKHRADVPERLERTVMQLLAKRATDRPPSAGDVLTALSGL